MASNERRVWRAVAVPLAPLVFIAMSACSSSQGSAPSTSITPIEAAKAVFLRWNDLAVRNDPKATEFLCTSPEISEQEPDPLPADHPGFNVPAEMNVQVNDDLASVDFRDSRSTADKADDEDVFVTLYKQGETWKVCRYQITAPGGFG